MRIGNQIKVLTICFVIIAIFSVFGCGGGGSGSYSGSSNAGGEIDTTYSSSISLEWDAPIDNVDGSPLNDLAGYKIYYGTASGNYTQSVNVGNTTDATIKNLSSGNWCFAATAYNSARSESNFSNEFCSNIEI